MRQWQEQRRKEAVEDGYVTTILGRRRQLPDAKYGSKAAQGHALRAAINTPIQGSAADIATAAMLRIDADETLRDLGWRLLLQVRRGRGWGRCGAQGAAGSVRHHLAATPLQVAAAATHAPCGGQGPKP